MLIFKRDEKGCKSYKIPICDCGSAMLPKDLDVESGVWKCPYCMKEKEMKDD